MWVNCPTRNNTKGTRSKFCNYAYYIILLKNNNKYIMNIIDYLLILLLSLLKIISWLEWILNNDILFSLLTFLKVKGDNGEIIGKRI